MRRALIWLLVLPFAAAGVLAGHAVAYRVTGSAPGELHAYLAHAPQIVVVLATLALLGLAADARARRSSPIPLALLAIGTFVAQEHLERLIHTGELPFLLTSRVLWVGIAVQIPLTLAVWWFARRLADDLASSARRTAPRPGVVTVPLVAPSVCLVACSETAVRGSRGPPVTL